jgi:hypothetical protein
VGRLRSLLVSALAVTLMFGASPVPAAATQPLTVTVVSDGSPSLRGTPVLFTVTVTPDPGPTGHIQLYRADNDSPLLQRFEIGAGGVTSITWYPSATLELPIKACYTSYENANTCSEPITQSVFAYATTTTLEISPSSVYAEEPVTFRVKVTPAPGVPVDVRVARYEFSGLGFDVGIDPETGIGEVSVPAFNVRGTLGFGRYQLTAYTPRTMPTDPSHSAAQTLDVVPHAPAFLVDDGPFTRSSIVYVAFGHISPSETTAVEYRLSNDPALAAGILVNGAAVERSGPWTLAAGPDGPRTIYGQFKDPTGLWSSVREVDLIVDQDPPSALYVDMDPQPGLGYEISLPPGSDWHTSSSTPLNEMLGHPIDPMTPSPHGFRVSDGKWEVSLHDRWAPLVAGTYVIPSNINEGNCIAVCATVAGSLGNDCVGNGTFTIHEIAYTAAGDLETLAADFRLLCIGTYLMSGSIRYGSGLAVVALDQSKDELLFGETIVGAQTTAQSVTFTNFGTAAAALGAATFVGPASGDFAITNDTCSNHVLAVSASCSVDIRFTASTRGQRLAHLSIPDGTVRGSRSVMVQGFAYQPTTLAIAAPVVPAFGPGMATITVTAAPPPTGTPVLMIDGVQAFGPTDQVLSGPSRHTWTYSVMLQPGAHIVTASYEGADFFAGSAATPLHIDVGIATTLTLATATDDGVAIGESVDLVARLEAGASLTGGTLLIRDGETKAVVASKAVSGTSATLTHRVVGALGAHPFKAEFVPSDPKVQAKTTSYSLVVVAGGRPETVMASTTLMTAGFSVNSSFSSPDSGVTFQCRFSVSNVWFSCASPQAFVQNNPGTYQILVRAIRPNGLADRTPASRAWIVDLTPPSGTTSVAGGATYVASSTVTVSTPATDAASGVRSVALSNDGTRWTTRAYAPSQLWTLPTTNGTRQVFVKWRNGAGAWSAIKSDAIALDTVAPIVTAPQRGFVVGSAISDGRITLRVPWSGSDATSGIARYQFAQRTDAGAWTIVATALTSPRIDRSLPVGHTYQFRVRAIDKAGNIGAWASGPSINLARFSESSTRISYIGSWRTVRDSAFWGGAARTSSTAGAKASITFTGRSIAWIARKGPNRGKAIIYVNGVQVASVDLYAATYQNQRVAWAATWSSSIARKVTIRVVGTSSRPRVDVDAFVTAN